MRYRLLIVALMLSACSGPDPVPQPAAPPLLMDRRRGEAETAVLGTLRLGDDARTLREALVAAGLDPATVDRASGVVRTEWRWDDRTLSLQRHDAPGGGPAPGRWILLMPWNGRTIWSELNLQDGRFARVRIGGVRRPELIEGNLLTSLYAGAMEPAERDARAWFERLGSSLALTPITRIEEGSSVNLGSTTGGLRLQLRLTKESYDNRPQITSSIMITAEDQP